MSWRVTVAALVSLDVEHRPGRREVALDHLQPQVLCLGQRAVHGGDGGRHAAGEEEEGARQSYGRRRLGTDSIESIFLPEFWHYNSLEVHFESVTSQSKVSIFNFFSV